MTQKIDPFIHLNWGWDTGEGGWGEGMNQNLIIQAFLQNKRIDSVISNASLLPVSPNNGEVYFAVADKTIYLRADGSWYTLLPTKGMTFILKATEEVVKFNDTTLVTDTKDIDEVVGLQAALDAKVPTTAVGAASGVAPLGADSKVPAIYLPISGSYSGTWNAATNTPTIVSSVGTNGQYYKVSVSGSTSINGVSSWSVGDEIKYNGSVWERIPNTSAVASVNGYTGSVVLTNTDVGAAATSHTHPSATTSVAGYLSTTDKTKLDAIASGATANSSDATLLNRANHTGTQAQSTIVNLTTDLAAKQATLVSGTNIKTINGNSLLGAGDITISGGGGGSTSFLGLTDTPSSYATKAFNITRVNSNENGLEFVTVGSAAYANTTDFANSSHTHGNATTSLAGYLSATDKTKLDGIATAATANSSDATLLNRANHTGTQAQSTIVNLTTDLAAKAGLINPTFTTSITLDAAAGQVSVYFKQNGVTNGRIYGAGGSGTDVIVESGRFVTVVPTNSFLIKPANVDKFSFDANGNFNILGVSARITADFSNVTETSRTMFQTSTLNSVTRIDAIPNGTATTATVGAFNNSDPTNASWTRLTATATDCRLEATKTGTGTYLPLVLHTGGSAKAIMTSNGNFLLSTGTDSGYRLDVNGNTRVSGDLTTNGNIVISKAAPVTITTSTTAAVGTMSNYHSFRDSTAAEVGWFGYATSNGEMAFNNSSRAIRFLSPTAFNGNVSTGGSLKVRYNAGAAPNYTNGQLELNNNGSANPVVMGFHAEGVSAAALVHLNGGNGLELYNTTFGSYANFKAATITATSGFSGDGSSLTTLNASNISAGTLNAARLPFTYTPTNTASAVVQRDGNGDISVSNLVASNAVYLGGAGLLANISTNSQNGIWRLNSNSNYGISYFHGSSGVSGQDTIGFHFGTATSAGSPFKFRADGILYANAFEGNGTNLSALNAGAITTGTLSDSRLSSNVALVSNIITKATPTQLFQNLGNVTGSVTVNGGNGIHVLATATGITTWTFPTPSSTEAIAITLELTNGGAFTQVWPSGTRWSGGTAPLLTSSGTDVLVFSKAGVNNWRGYLSSKDSK